MKQKANFYVSIPKDFGSVKQKVALGLTKRQLICFLGAGLVGVPIYLLLKNMAEPNMAMLVMVLVMAPFFAFALYEKDGLPLEAILKMIIDENYIRPKVRPVMYEPVLAGVEQVMNYDQMMKEKKESSFLFFGRKKEAEKKDDNTPKTSPGNNKKPDHDKKEPEKKAIFKKTKNGKKGIGPNDPMSTEMLRDYAAAMHKAQRTGKRPPKSASESLPFKSMSEDGILHQKSDEYAILMSFEDINYEQANVNNQKDIWSDWCMLLNSFDIEANYQFVYYNKYADVDETAKKLRLVATEDKTTNQMVKELNDYIYGILKKGNKGMEKHMYLVVSFKSSYKKLRIAANEIRERLSNEFEEKLGIKNRWLDGYEWLSALFYMVNPYRDEKFLFSWDARKTGMLSEKEQLCNHAFTFGSQINTFRVGSKVGCASYLKISANKLSDRFLADFLNLDSEVIISFHVEGIHQNKAVKMVKALLTNLQKMVIDEQKTAVNNGYGMNNVSPELKRNVEGAEELLDNVSMDDEKLFYVTITMVQIADTPNKLTRNFNAAHAIASAQTCELVRLDHQQENGYFSSLPLGVNKLAIKRLLTTTSLGVFLPFKIKELLQFGESLCIGYNKITGHIIMADIKRLQNPNMIVLGKPGRGKSFFVKMMMLQVFLKTKDDILICDPEGEYHPLVRVMGGQMIKLCAGSPHHINPLDMNPDMEDVEVALVDKATFVMSMFEQILKGKSASDPQDRSIIDRALRKIYDSFLHSRDTADLPTFTELFAALKEDDSKRAKYLTDTFEVYVHGSLNFFNHRTNINMDNRVVCFDIRDLSNELKDLGMLFVQETVWSKVSANRERKKYTRYFIDEFHVLLKDAQTAAYSKDIWKRFRKWLGMPCGITQNVTDLMMSPEIKTIFDNSDCYVILGQDENEAAMLSEELNLTAKQQKCISTRSGGEGLFIYGGDVMPYVGRIPQEGTIYKTITTRFAETDADQVSAALLKAEVNVSG